MTICLLTFMSHYLFFFIMKVMKKKTFFRRYRQINTKGSVTKSNATSVLCLCVYLPLVS